MGVVSDPLFVGFHPEEPCLAFYFLLVFSIWSVHMDSLVIICVARGRSMSELSDGLWVSILKRGVV